MARHECRFGVMPKRKACRSILHTPEKPSLEDWRTAVLLRQAHAIRQVVPVIAHEHFR